MLRWRTAVLSLGLVLWASTAQAQVDEEIRQRVGEIGTDGLALYDAGDCAAALQRFDEAAAILRTPTLELYASRCLARLERVVEAIARYRALDDLFPGDTSPAFMSAKDQAKLELGALLRRAPKIQVTVSGGWQPGTVVRLDGEPLDKSALDSPLPLDPGRHVLDAEREGERACSVAEVSMGKTSSVELRLGKHDAPAPKQAAVADDDIVHLGLGWGLVALGGAGLVVGGVLVGLAAGKKADLEDQGCTEDLCPVTFAEDVSSYDAMRIGSTIAFIAGGATVVLGVTLLLTLPDRPGEETTSLAIRLGADGAVARVTF